MDGKSVPENSRTEYRGFAGDMHGPTVISADKDISSGQDIISTGWHINIRYDVWRICPKPKAIDKIFANLFYRLPSDICDEDVICR